MENKSKVISRLLLYISIALTFLFVIAVCFLPLAVSGVVYVIFIAVYLAFALLKFKYNTHNTLCFKWSQLVAHSINIVALALFIKSSYALMLCVVLVVLALILDSVIKQTQKLKVLNLICNVLYGCFMAVIVPLLFLEQMSLTIIILLFAIICIYVVLKIYILKNNDKVVIKEENKKADIDDIDVDFIQQIDNSNLE